jgi:hypothetical protein
MGVAVLIELKLLAEQLFRPEADRRVFCASKRTLQSEFERSNPAPMLVEIALKAADP